MEWYLKIAATVLVAVVLCIVLSKQGKDISILLSLAVCCIILASAETYLRAVLDFVVRLTQIGNLHGEMIQILIRIAGIGIVSRIAGFICTDAGNQTLGKALQVITTITVLYLSLPLLEEMISIIEMAMENL